MTSAWEIRSEDYPSNASIEEKIHFWLNYAVLAPSAHNTQPWSYKIDTNTIHVYRNDNHTLKAGDPTLRETFISLGAFLENLLIAANHWDNQGTVHKLAFYSSDKEAAVVNFEQAETQSESNTTLFDAITKRHTNRGFYHESDFPAEFKALTHELEQEAGIQSFLIEERDQISRISELVGKGTYTALSMQGMMHELSSLLFSAHDQKPTGMILQSMIADYDGNSEASSWFLQNLNPQKEADYWQATFTSSPALMVIGSEKDGPESWIRSGQVMQRLLLAAAAFGMTHSLAAAPVEIPTLAPLLRKEIDPLFRPQVLFRLGKPKLPETTFVTPRRSAEENIIDHPHEIK